MHYDDRVVSMACSCDDFVVPHKDSSDRVQHQLLGWLVCFETAVCLCIKLEGWVALIVDSRDQGEKHRKRSEHEMSVQVFTVMVSHRSAFTCS
jgi:hypothetical protein